MKRRFQINAYEVKIGDFIFIDRQRRQVLEINSRDEISSPRIAFKVTPYSAWAFGEVVLPPDSKVIIFREFSTTEFLTQKCNKKKIKEKRQIEISTIKARKRELAEYKAALIYQAICENKEFPEIVELYGKKTSRQRILEFLLKYGGKHVHRD